MERLAEFDLGVHAEEGDGKRIAAMAVEIRALRAQVTDLEDWIRYALEYWAPAGSEKAERMREALGG